MSPFALEQSSELEQLGAVVERLPIGVVMFGVKDRRIRFANNAAQRLVHPAKLRRGAELPEPWSDFSFRRYADRLVDLGVGPEERVTIDERHTFVVSSVATQGSEMAVILIENISQRDHRARAEREFVANAAHELLTPLTGIVGAAHVLQAGAKNVPEDRDRFIAHIEAECSRLTRVARSLLILARAQSGEEPPRLEIFKLCELLAEVTGHLHADITIRCDDGLTVFADADLLVQALSNLIANGVRHGSGGSIVVEVREAGAGLVEVDIVDAEAAPSDAGEFRGRFRSAAGRDGGGFGLGLAIAEQSLELIGGRLLLDGDSVRVQLPGGALAPK